MAHVFAVPAQAGEGVGLELFFARVAALGTHLGCLVLLRHAACLSDTGGGIFSATSNALIGIIELGATAACDDPAGETIALQLAPFRNLLLAAAEDARETLYIEPDRDAIELRCLSDCAPP